jgi:hypothetical protein
MVDGFDVVQVGIGEVGAVVAGVVVGSFAGLTERGVAGSDACLVERVYRVGVRGVEREVQVLAGLGGGRAELYSTVG